MRKLTLWGLPCTGIIMIHLSDHDNLVGLVSAHDYNNMVNADIETEKMAGMLTSLYVSQEAACELLCVGIPQVAECIIELPIHDELYEQAQRVGLRAYADVAKEKGHDVH